ncbi:MAG: MFS transporter [Anaerolineae bacterium]|nr:MFS transporter [Anaerolineae bacterium]
MTNLPINRRLLTIICFIAFICLGMASGILGPTIPDIAGAVGLPLASAGLLRGVRQVGSFIAILGGGRLLDRRDPRVILIPGAIIFALGLIGNAYSHNLAVVLIASLLVGIGSGVFDVTPNVIIGAIYAAGASSVLTALHTFFGLGGSVGPLITQVATDQGDWRLAYLALTIAVLIVGVSFFSVKLRPQAAPESAGQNSGRIRWLLLLPLMVLIFSYSGAGNGMSDWLYTHMSLAARTDNDTASRVTSLYWLALTAGRIINIFTLRKFTNLRVLTVGLSVSAVGAALILFGGAQVALITLGVVLVGLGFSPIFPVVIAMGGQQQPEARGTITGILAGVAAVGGIIVPYVQGLVGGGQSGGMIVPLAAAVIMLIALTTLRSRNVVYTE